MYDYIATRILAKPCNEDITDLLAAFLAEIDYETFTPDSEGLLAYVRKDKYNEEALKEILMNFPIPSEFTFSNEVIEGEDWNSEWERNYFKPISIDDKVVIRSSFHNDYPEAPIEIIIDPKMAFGTGHHATTAGMSRMLLEEDLKDKTVIDMGTGTGILAILAKKLGAGDTVGIDIDKFAIENAVENSALNNVSVQWISGDDHALEKLKAADVFLANINLNVITTYLSKYLEKLKKGGKIFLSGFLSSDIPEIHKHAKENDLRFIKSSEENNWATLVFAKY